MYNSFMGIKEEENAKNMVSILKDEGVEAYVQQLGQELKNTMMMTGVSSLKEISKKNIYK